MFIEDTFFYTLLFLYTPYGYCQAYETNDEVTLYGLAMFVVSMLEHTILSMSNALALIAFFGSSALFLKSKIRKEDKSLFLFSMMFLMMSVYFLGDMLWRA